MQQKKILLVNGQKKLTPSFIQACKENNLDCKVIKTNEILILATQNSCSLFHNEEKLVLEDFSYGFIRLRGKANHMTSILAYMLKKGGIPFNDPINLDHGLSGSKITQMIRMSIDNLPIPKTIIFSHKSYKTNFKVIQENISFPCVLKTKGERGNAVWKINDIEDLEKNIFSNKEQLLMIQELIPNKSDIRAVFFNDNFIAAIERFSTDGFYNNVSKGGTFKQVEISEEEKALCIKASKISDLDFSGVDFVRTEKGILFFEVNKSPQLNGLELATNLNVAKILVSKINEII